MGALARRAGLLAVITVSLAGCGHAAAPPHGVGTPATSSRPAAGSAAASTRATSPPAPSEASRLAVFMTAAGQADSQLRHAAVLVNAGIGTTSMRFTPAAVAAVGALSNAPAARAIPAGLPVELLRRVLAVYGDLSSRNGAFGGVRLFGQPERELPVGGQDARDILRGLHNGAPAAARFGTDLAAVGSLAQQTPPLAVAAPDSRAAAELALRLTSIDKRNHCSYQFGGFAPTQLETVTWQPASKYSRHYDGTISGGRFQADYTAAHGWQININAC